MKQITINVSGLSTEEKQRVTVTGTPATPQQALEMAEKRKVRKDFDKRKEYSVDVSNCTEEEKKKVQQAFFDVGFMWESVGKEYIHLDAVQYTNTTGTGCLNKHCMYGTTTEDCNMNPDEFFSYVYEPVQQGHVHAENMTLYAEDAKTTDKPWELWQFKDSDGVWWTIHGGNPMWQPATEYRRKPRTKLIHGVEIPDISIAPSGGEMFYTPNTLVTLLVSCGSAGGNSQLEHLVSNGLCYPCTEEGKQAAILHAKAMLGID